MIAKSPSLHPGPIDALAPAPPGTTARHRVAVECDVDDPFAEFPALCTVSSTDSALPPTPAPPAARDILDACFGEFRSRVTLLARRSFEQSGDLFDGNSFVSQADVDQFKSERGAWLASFDATLRELYERRLSGIKRKGRRPDFDASLGSLCVLTAFDHEKQAALTQRVTALVERLTRTELAALGRRIEVLLPEQQRNDVDNPFAPAYLLDAIGVTSRTVYPNARICAP